MTGMGTPLEDKLYELTQEIEWIRQQIQCETHPIAKISLISKRLELEAQRNTLLKKKGVIP